jgi:two-component system NtrC family sensor kinase
MAKGGLINIDLPSNNEEKFKLLLKHMKDWVYWIGNKGEILFMSPSCEVLTGYTYKDFIKSPSLLHTIVHHQDKLKYNKHLEEVHNGALKDGEAELEFRIITKDMQIRVIQHVCSPIFDEQGNYLGRSVSNSNITERKQAELALIKKNEEIEFFHEASIDLLTEFNYQKITDHGCQISGAVKKKQLLELLKRIEN